jgi:hypothetical protein
MIGANSINRGNARDVRFWTYHCPDGQVMIDRTDAVHDRRIPDRLRVRRFAGGIISASDANLLGLGDLHNARLMHNDLD